jgi:hypothetical protein
MTGYEPFTAGYLPPVYPHHDFTGPGIVVHVRVGGELVGDLSRQGERVSWNSAAPVSAEGRDLRQQVHRRLRQGAAAGRELDDVWHELLAAVPHDPPYLGDLAELRAAIERRHGR